MSAQAHHTATTNSFDILRDCYFANQASVALLESHLEALAAAVDQKAQQLCSRKDAAKVVAKLRKLGPPAQSWFVSLESLPFEDGAKGLIDYLDREAAAYAGSFLPGRDFAPIWLRVIQTRSLKERSRRAAKRERQAMDFSTAREHFNAARAVLDVAWPDAAAEFYTAVSRIIVSGEREAEPRRLFGYVVVPRPDLDPVHYAAMLVWGSSLHVIELIEQRSSVVSPYGGDEGRFYSPLHRRFCTGREMVHWAFAMSRVIHFLERVEMSAETIEQRERASALLTEFTGRHISTLDIIDNCQLSPLGMNLVTAMNQQVDSLSRMGA